MAADEAQRALGSWLEARGLRALAMKPLAGDVSPRRYFRLLLAQDRGAEVVVAAYYPEASRAVCARFLASGELLAGVGVRVPAVLAADCEAGVMLLEDLGERTLYDRRDEGWPRLAPALGAAIAALARLRALPHAEIARLNPPLDEALLRRELQQTSAKFLEPRGMATGELRVFLDSLCRELGGQRPLPCHRDFMARNLVPVDGDVAVLDHQDLRLGPPAYDIASLLNDSLFPPAPEAETLRRRAGFEERPYLLAVVQRTLKAVGTFAAFAERGSPQHLGLVAPTLRRCLEALETLPEAAALAHQLRARWRPAIC